MTAASILPGAHSMMKPVVEIRPYRAGDAVAFRELNEDWIEKIFRLEESDRSALGDPERYILERGGHIFMATAGDEAVGCCALLLMRPGVYEVAKMTVAEAYRGQGLGRKLLAYTIAQGKALGAKSLYLETNKKLGDAIHLYEALGFRHLPPERVVPRRISGRMCLWNWCFSGVLRSGFGSSRCRGLLCMLRIVQDGREIIKPWVW